MSYCKTCEWRDSYGYCRCPKLYELGPYTEPKGEKVKGDDHLVYSYNEDGSFWVGEKFGCAHHKEKQ